MSIFNRAYLYIIRKKVRSSILFLIVTLISFFLLSGSVLNTTADNKNKPFKLTFKGLVFVSAQNLRKACLILF